MVASEEAQAQTVRFSDVNEEIEPDALEHVPSLTGSADDETQPLDEEAKSNIREISKTLQNARCQARYEPMSLPPSRAPSPTPASRTASGHSSHRFSSSARPSPPASAMHSPPLTPAGTSSHEGKPSMAAEQRRDPAMMTPQISPPHEPPPTSMDAVHSGERKRQSMVVLRSPKSAAHTSARPASVSDMSGIVGPHPKNPATFAIGPTGDSLPPSRDVSPSGSAGTRTPGHDSPTTSTPGNSRPYTPQENRDDPYSRSKRAPQPRNIDSLDARFVFGNGRKNHHHASPSASSINLPFSKANDSVPSTPDKRLSFFGGSKNNRQSSADDSDARSVAGKQHGSMSELKRFFKIGGHKHKDKDKDKKAKRNQSPAPSVRDKIKSKKTIPMSPAVTGGGSSSIPFADDHGLESRYGKFGKVLGSGAGGSVRLMKRSGDGVTFAVKQFRARHTYESERDYNKKVTAEFCIGSTLHHGNIIETMDLVNEKGNYYVVMEYAPFDLFAIVMTGKMSREEMACSTLQILNGVAYLHNMGLAHRDLKLDNVVVNEHGIMKIIDFGSAAVFKYPFENGIVLASGIVGSDPYLAPEVYDLSKYDPQPTDIWSLAIIFCCMTLRRFPWKAPRVSDNSYKLFVAPPNDNLRSITSPSKSSADLHPDSARDDHHRKSGLQSEPASRAPSGQSSSHHHHHKNGGHSDPLTNDDPSTPSTANSQPKESSQPQVIKGPWRLLRLLPRESRHIISRMLEVDPKKRATLKEILDDKWIKNNQVCRQEEGGKVLRAPNHEHTLEPGAGSASAPNTQQKK